MNKNKELRERRKMRARTNWLEAVKANERLMRQFEAIGPVLMLLRM